MHSSMKHIIINGRNGVGKSTLIRSVLERIQSPVYGVITKKEAEKANGFQPVYIHLYGKERQYSEENRIGMCKPGESICFPDVFDRFCDRMRFPKNCVIVFDELGFMESDAHRFTAKVLHTLDEAPLCICAVRDKPTPFLDAVRSHPRAEVYEITEENRNELRARILAVLSDRTGD